jgi:hypothetical protein
VECDWRILSYFFLRVKAILRAKTRLTLVFSSVAQTPQDRATATSSSPGSDGDLFKNSPRSKQPKRPERGTLNPTATKRWLGRS